MTAQPPLTRFVATCPTLFSERAKPAFSENVVFSRFHGLDAPRRLLVEAWHAKALDSAADPFEGFLYAWVAFNGWGSCVSDQERDFKIIGALGRCREVVNAFDTLLDTPAFTTRAATFAGLWPIFAVKNVRGHGPSHEVERPQLIDHYLAATRDDFQPRCWAAHRDQHEKVPVDWPHTLAALYRVRNNLFHGDKDPYSESDRTIVAAAYDVLSAFLPQLMGIQHP